MPHVIVKLHPGRSDEKKIELAEKIVQNVASIAGCDEKFVSVSFEEIGSEEWFEKVYEPDIQNKQDQLVIKPGYGPPGES